MREVGKTSKCQQRDWSRAVNCEILSLQWKLPMPILHWHSTGDGSCGGHTWEHNVSYTQTPPHGRSAREEGMNLLWLAREQKKQGWLFAWFLCIWWDSVILGVSAWLQIPDTWPWTPRITWLFMRTLDTIHVGMSNRLELSDDEACVCCTYACVNTREEGLVVDLFLISPKVNDNPAVLDLTTKTLIQRYFSVPFYQQHHIS